MFIDYSDPNNVVITHNKEKYTGKICYDEFDCWLHICAVNNYYPADVLNVRYPKFIKSILGYDRSNNSVKSKEDLIKVLDAFNKEYDKKFGNNMNPEDLKEGDYIYIKDGWFEAIYIFKSFENPKINRYVCYKYNDIIDVSNNYIVYKKDTKIRKATSDEIQTLNNALCVQYGLFWNPCTKSLESVGITTLRSDWHDLTVNVGAVNTNAMNIDGRIVNTSVDRVTNYSSKPKEVTIDINNFITKNKHYQLNFNN